MMIKRAFWDSMTAAQEIPLAERKTPVWEILETRYEEWDPSRRRLPHIPQIIHQIWLGSPVPRLYAQWGQTWKHLNPGWEYRLWTEREIDEFGLVNRESYEKASNFGVKSDLARYEILATLGGVYADTDFECLASFEELANSTEFFAGLMYSSSPAIANGMIGSSPGHPILQRMIQDLSEPFLGHDGMDILAYSGPTKFTNIILEHFAKGGRGVALPTTYFYPFPSRELEYKDIAKARTWAEPESLAIHYWEVSWRTQSFASKVYWWMKIHLPRWLFVGIYRLVKGKDPT